MATTKVRPRSGDGGLPPHYTPRKIMPNMIEGLRADYFDGATVKELALKHKVSSATIRQYL